MYKFVENNKHFLAIELTEESPYPGLRFTIDFSTVVMVDEPPAEDGSARVTFDYQILDKAGHDVDEKSESFSQVAGAVFLDILDKALNDHTETLASEATDLL